jgi:hypothetical protein
LGTSASSHLRAPRGGSFHYEPLVRRHYVCRRVGRGSGHARRDGTADGASFAIGIAVSGTGRSNVGFTEPVACGGRGADVGFTEPIGGAGRADVGFAEPIARGGCSADVGFTEPIGGAGCADVGFAKPIACGGRLGAARSSGISDPNADVDDESLTHRTRV